MSLPLAYDYAGNAGSGANASMLPNFAAICHS
jgi:hypothetical protein